MAGNTFNTHLTDVEGVLQRLDNLLSDIDKIMKRHVANDYSSLVAADYDGRQATKIQYDNATSSLANLQTWRVTHNTNIQNYLYEIP